MAETMNASVSDELFDTSTTVVFSCRVTQQFSWDLRQIICYQIAIVVTVAAFPLTVFLNFLVIASVKKNKELHTNSNILIAGLAVVDFLVGAVSMPLTIALDALIIRGTASLNIVCTTTNISGLVMYTAFNLSFYHLVFIAWERYVAIVKWMEYKVIVTKERMKRNSRIIWLITVKLSAFYLVLANTGARSEFLLALNVVHSLACLIGMSLMAYFYLVIYLKTQKLKDAQIRRVNVLIKARTEKRISYTVFLITVAVWVSIIPFPLALVLALFSPSFRSYSILRMAVVFLHFNSLVNPTLYFYRNNRCRKAAVRLLRFEKPRAVEPVVRMGKHAERHGSTRPSLDVKELVDNERAPRLRKVQSFYATETQHHSLHNPQEPLTLTVTVQIEKVPRKKSVKETVASSHDRKSEKLHRLSRVMKVHSFDENIMETRAHPLVSKVERRSSAPSTFTTIESRSETVTCDFK